MPTRLLLALAVLASLAGAQAPTPQAAKVAVTKARVSAKAVLKEFRAAVDDERDGFLASLAGVEDKFTAGTGVLPDLDGLFDSATILQFTVQETTQITEDEVAAGVQAALGELANAGPLKDNYPVDLQIGTSGVLDDANVAIDKFLVKTYASLNKRLAKTEALVASSGGLRLRASLRPPGGSLPIAASETQAASLPAGLGIDVLWAERDANLSVKGRVLLAGTNFTSSEDTDLDVHLVHVGETIGGDTVVVQAHPGVIDSGRWTAEFLDVAHGSYICRVTPQGGGFGPFCATSFGLP